jgi:hypothetical protein
MRVFDTVREKVGQSPRLFWTTRARNGRQRLAVDLLTPRVSDVGSRSRVFGYLSSPRVSGVGGRSRVLVLWCVWDPVIDRFRGKGVGSD